MESHKGSLILYPEKLKEIVSKTNPVILEIGCNDGLDTQQFLQIFPGLQVILCFEPDPRAIQQFKARIKDPRCILLEVALGECNGTQIFYQSGGTKKGAYKKDWDLSGSLNKPTGHLEYSPWVTFKKTIEVPVLSLDFALAADKLFPLIDLIWMDVQGGERNVIRGGRETLKKTRYVYAEFGHWKKPLYEGQMNKEQTIEELGDGWEPIAIYENCNILAKNTKCPN